MKKISRPNYPGINSAPSNPGAPTTYPLAYTSMPTVVLSVSGGSASYVDLNIGGSVPASAMVVQVVCNPTAANLVGVRKVGAITTRQINAVIGSYITMDVECPSRHIEAYEPAAGSNNYAIIGYWS